MAEKEKTKTRLDLRRLPSHVAIIMDGNGRWAQERGLPRSEGHRAGMEALRGVVEASLEIKLPVLTVYAFSTENWKRPPEEVAVLMNLLGEYLSRELAALHEQGVRVRVLGEWGFLPPQTRAEIERAIRLTADNQGLIFNVALNYGGRAEIVSAAREIAVRAVAGEIKPGEINEELFARFLFTAGLPEPDLLIRTAGEMRLSNFLLWQLAYTEFWFTSLYWPDFKKEKFLAALLAYQERKRRFGGI